MATTLKMLTVRTLGVFCVAMMGAGCTAVDEPLLRGAESAPGAPPPGTAPPQTPSASTPAATPPAAPATSQTGPKPPNAAKTAAVPAPLPAPSAPIVTPKQATPALAAKRTDPALDLASLKTRLRETPAIGVFTKLALQNQVDDLLARFRTHYQSGRNAEVASLRQPYEMLVMKVLALLQDSDPALARTIAGSREALWGILADPQKFKSATI